MNYTPAPNPGSFDVEATPTRGTYRLSLSSAGNLPSEETDISKKTSIAPSCSVLSTIYLREIHHLRRFRLCLLAALASIARSGFVVPYNATR